MQLRDVLEALHSLADPEVVEFKRRKFGIVANNSLGIFQKDLKALAKQIKPNDELALELYATGIYEARLLTSRLYSPSKVSKSQMSRWAGEFENWEICDSFCMGFFAKSPHAIEKALRWAENRKEFVKRAAFAIMASYGMADKQAGNEVFEPFLTLAELHANDDRIYVKKAVNWALRSIGKRNIDLKQSAIETAKRIAQQDARSAKWIARDALRELQGPSVKIQDHPRKVYRV